MFYFNSLIIKIFSKRKLISVLVLAILFGIVFYLRQAGYITPEKIIFFLESHYLSAPILFIIIYALMVVFLLPTLPMNLGAGFLWSGFWGGVITVLGASFGASISFIVSRYLVSDYLNKKFKNKFWLWFKEKVKKNDWKFIAFTRANPAFPFCLVSYFFGLTNVSLKKYLTITMIAIIPGSFIVAALGDFIGDIILTNRAYNFLQIVIIAGAIITLFIIVRYGIKKYPEISHFKIPSTLDQNKNDNVLNK